MSETTPSTSRTPPKVPRPAPAPRVDSPAIARLEAQLAAGTDVDTVVAEFWNGPAARTPLIEPVVNASDAPRDDAPHRFFAESDGPSAEVSDGQTAAVLHERIVTFLWRDADAADVLLFVNRLTDERDLERSLMHRIPGTDLWHLSYRMRSDWRASYAFLVRPAGAPAPWTDGQDQIAVRKALDHGLLDPGNPEVGRNRDGVLQSFVSLPDAPAAIWLEPRGAALEHGMLEERATPDGRRVWVYEPPGGVPAGAPVVVALDGEVWTGSQDLPTTIDNLIADGEIRAPLVVLPDSGGRAQRWLEMDAHGDAAGWVADVLLPWVRDSYDVSDAAADTIVVGQSLGGLTALRIALTRPDAFGAVLSQSASLWQDDLRYAIAGRCLDGLRAHVEVGAQEWVLREPNRLFAERLQAAGADVLLAEYNGGHDYACWRIGIAHGLRRLLAP